MPAWLTWKAFWKIVPYLGGALALLGAVWYLDNRGYQRAEQEATARENERKLQAATFAILLGQQVKGLEGSMQTAINESDAKIVGSLNNLDITNKMVIQPTLIKEIQSEKRFTDPAAGITDGMLRELNRARGFSVQRPCPASSNAVACFDLPAAEPADGQVDRNPSN